MWVKIHKINLIFGYRVKKTSYSLFSGATLAPLTRALEVVTEMSTFDPNFLQPSSTDPDSDKGKIP